MPTVMKFLRLALLLVASAAFTVGCRSVTPKPCTAETATASLTRLTTTVHADQPTGWTVVPVGDTL